MTDSTGRQPEPTCGPGCLTCACEMTRSSGGEWLCGVCGFLLTCCDPP